LIAAHLAGRRTEGLEALRPRLLALLLPVLGVDDALSAPESPDRRPDGCTD
jgi:hypothetical protein